MAESGAVTERRSTKSAAEDDVVGFGRRYYCYLTRPGVSAGIKRQIRRRERHDANQAVRRD